MFLDCLTHEAIAFSSMYNRRFDCSRQDPCGIVESVITIGQSVETFRHDCIPVMNQDSSEPDGYVTSVRFASLISYNCL